MTRPLVSVIIPAYNHERYIEACLESVLAQDYKPLEVILIDDGSKDDTFEIAQSILSRTCPTAVRFRNDNNGAARTINLAIGMAQGKYINIVNSDDFFEPTRVSLCVDSALRRRAELVFTNVNFVDEFGRNADMDDYMLSLYRAGRRATSFPTLGFAFLKDQLAISTGNIFFTKRLFDSVGGFNEYLYVHDWDFILRSLFYTEPLYLDSKLYNYRFHGTNSSKSLADVSEYETSEILANALWRLTSKCPVNPRAPCPWYWPGVFEQFVRQWGYEVYLPPRFHGGARWPKSNRNAHAGGQM